MGRTGRRGAVHPRPRGEPRSWSGIENRGEIDDLLTNLCLGNSTARVVQVDYSASVAGKVSQRFCEGKPIPGKDCYGKAVYPYIFGLWAAVNPYVLHVDSDMLFGGGSQTWVAQARKALARPEVLSCSPFPGPPTAAPLRREVAIRHAGSRRRRALWRNAVPVSLPGVPGPALRFSRMSTRGFMLDRSILGDGAASAPVGRPSLRALLGAASKGALTHGNPLREPAEVSLSRAMQRLGLLRVDFLGTSPGMWSIHPASRTADFYDALPDIIERIEANDIPPRQRGDYDLNSSMIEHCRAPAK